MYLFSNLNFLLSFLDHLLNVVTNDHYLSKRRNKRKHSSAVISCLIIFNVSISMSWPVQIQILLRPAISYSWQVRSRALEKLAGTQGLQHESAAKSHRDAERDDNNAFPICSSILFMLCFAYFLAWMNSLCSKQSSTQIKITTSIWSQPIS